MVSALRRLDPVLLGQASAVTGAGGVLAIVFGGAAVATAGVVLIIASAISLFFAVGSYIGAGEPAGRGW